MTAWKPDPLERSLTFRVEILTRANVEPYIARYIDLPVSAHFDANLISRVKSPDNWDPQYEVVPTDLDLLWIGQPKPEGYVYPEAYTKGRSDGSLERITKLYSEHYKIKILDPSPVKA